MNCSTILLYRFFCLFLLITYISCSSVSNQRIHLEKKVSFTQIEEAQSFLHTLEIHFQIITEILQNIRILAVRSSHKNHIQEDRNQFDLEFQELLKEICRIRESARFRNIFLLDTENSSRPISISLQIDPQSSPILLPLPELQPEEFGLHTWSLKKFQSKMNVKTNTAAVQSIDIINNSLSKIAFERATIGASWERLSYSKRLRDSLSNIY
ncbi:flagellin [Leptospira kirschneri]|uniref:Flagellin N-terminal domain protein n=1 Tax=Leptospira kirschneri str. 200802841 TaxID=1193047 RepID=A0A828Y5L8_9LEPT|nr:flagellin [Leptospira kirschneri]EKO52511.1 flagellin N-terminal domain protein [Leptospira kirschneri str. 200802841]EKQ84339.1 flagellin N-terminal domain protein [Leptospira kirschneri serovar Grippotyphosa str. Moskva]EKR06762.1 flagellin N-terminal domain protein [Leptospira kirschneri serovar Valbuzzi str. 200702274]EMK02120.1 flagellin N-terminal domain protein [Leptospira kirschneri str. MMD1493]EMK18935.1 flagellin N-terminal domain protein [Leptospira kirschneri serovar Bim str. P